MNQAQSHPETEGSEEGTEAAVGLSSCQCCIQAGGSVTVSMWQSVQMRSLCPIPQQAQMRTGR